MNYVNNVNMILYYVNIKWKYYIIRHRWKARWAYLSTSHHIKPGPLGEGLMWWLVLRSAHLVVPNDAVCIFWYEYLSETAKSNWAVKRIRQSARWADLTIRLVVKANSKSFENNGTYGGIVIQIKANGHEDHCLADGQTDRRAYSIIRHNITH